MSNQNTFIVRSMVSRAIQMLRDAHDLMNDDSCPRGFRSSKMSLESAIDEASGALRGIESDIAEQPAAQEAK